MLDIAQIPFVLFWCHSRAGVERIEFQLFKNVLRGKIHTENKFAQALRLRDERARTTVIVFADHLVPASPSTRRHRTQA